MIHLDGRHGEGGGQILRTALAMSMITQKPFRIDHIRAGRPKPGLKAQHLWGIRGLQQLSESQTEGAVLGSSAITFFPQPLRPKDITVDVQTAGSLTLLLQTVLPPLIFSHAAVTLTLIGGTDVKWSPPINHCMQTFLPAIRQIADVRIELVKRGFFPKGGGKILVHVPAGFERTSLEHVCTDEYLGDQLIPYLGMVGGSIKVPKLTNHIKSNVYAMEHFLDSTYAIENGVISFTRS